MENFKPDQNYLEAYKSVKKIKSFYSHVVVFVFMSLILIFSADKVIAFFKNISNTNDPNFLNWVKANIWVNLLIWLLVLVIHGLVVYKVKINVVQKWEERKINELLNKNS